MLCYKTLQWCQFAELQHHMLFDLSEHPVRYVKMHADDFFWFCLSAIYFVNH